MVANKFGDKSVQRMIDGLAKDGYASSNFLPEGWRVRYMSKTMR